MIRYQATEAELAASVDRECPSWNAYARSNAAANLAAGRLVNDDPSWGDIKPVFMRLQHYKCIYCERRLESYEIGRIEHDIDHFRPKSRVKVWPPKDVPKRKFPFATGKRMVGGYHWLAYDFANYAVACKVCKTILKKDYFPVAGLRGPPGSSVADLHVERPWLCYPIGDRDADPRDLIRFVGTIAVPACADRERRARAEVMIEIFHLNRRETLQRGRAKMIVLLGASLLAREDGRATPADDEIIRYCGTNAVEHASCCADFITAWSDNPMQGVIAQVPGFMTHAPARAASILGLPRA